MIVPRSLISVVSLRSKPEQKGLMKGKPMVVGLILFSSLVAALMTGLGLAFGMPIWAALITYAVVGSLTLLCAAAVLYARAQATSNQDCDHHKDLATA